MFISSKVSVALSWMILLTPKPVILGGDEHNVLYTQLLSSTVANGL